MIQRIFALILALVAIPAVLGISALLQDAPIRPDEPSPRTVIAPDLIRVPDQEATDRARREASEAIQPVLVDDDEAKAAIVQQVRDVFARAQAVREPGDEDQVPSRSEQIEALRDRLTMLDDDGLSILVGLGENQLDQVSQDALQIAQDLARNRIREDRVITVADETLQTELVVRSFPAGVAERVVAPVIRDAARPTVRVDETATSAARERAAREVADVMRSYPGGSVIVSAGENVDELQYTALRSRGLEGAEPWAGLARGFGLAMILTAAVAAYLRAYRTEIWNSRNRLLLLALLVTLFAVTLEAVKLLAPGSSSAWLYLIPVGAVAMLATILFDPPIGVLVTVPTTVMVAFAVPGEPGVVVFTAVASIMSVPLVSRLSARGDLRRAAWQSMLVYGVLAGSFTAVFGELEHVPTAVIAGLLNGVGTAVILNGSLPFLESVFGILTATSLLDLADRNHPLLRELEQKALGSYNHSIMVSTLCERAARSVGADSLLTSVAALYHDIGKVRRPYFFVENQSGMANPHDDLEPRVSATIIQDHVTDGIEMARSHRLPPEVVDGIATHHGTTLVSYFYRQAMKDAGTTGESIDEEHFRYKGRKPTSKELAILMLADCCEGASRAAALTNRNLSRGDLEQIVHQLVADRVEDGQLDESSLTFRELAMVQHSFIETLVGVYHPRISYPDPVIPPQSQGDGQAATAGKDWDDPAAVER